MARRDDYRRVAAILKGANRIALCVHMFPDGDALGSMTALALACRRMGKSVALFSPSELPRRYHFLPLYGAIRTQPPHDTVYDVAVALDCASQAQLGSFYHAVFQRAAKTVVIDHHLFRRHFTDTALVSERAAAVGEIIYDLAAHLGVRVDRRMAVAILVSLIVETGSFRLPSVTQKTFRICADLLGRGVDYNELVEQSYWCRTAAEAHLLGLCFARIRLYGRGRLAVSYITEADMKRYGGRNEDVDPIADQIRTLKNVRVVLLLRDMDKHRWRVSLRSKGRINVGRVAENFGGGGHTDVAGCYLKKSEKDKRRLIHELKALL
ncbi:MAG: DHH family phosphoesterase [Deltaproteobacteria bacterium]